MMTHKTLAGILILILLAALPLAGATNPSAFYQRGTIYLDWYGSRAPDGTFFNQISTRIRFDLISRPGNGWTLSLDARDRVGLLGTTRNQVILYNARLTFDRPGSLFYLSLGQMNLYDSAGIGELMGGVAGVKIMPSLTVGGFGGLESSPYVNRIESNYLKFGGFVRWLGAMGKQFSLSYNQLRYQGRTERQYVYANVFYPIERVFVLYGDVEYELGAHTASENRLSRVFVNGRLDLSRWFDLTGSYSSGRGLDYHQFLIEASQNPGLNDQNVERFFYSSYYGGRLSFKPSPNVRLSVGRLWSEQKDLNILNSTWRFSASAWNLLGQGISVTGDYSINRRIRGNSAEFNSYYASITKDFGRFSLTGSISNTYNGVRFDSTGGTPQLIHLNNYQNVGASTFIRISRSLWVSLEYNYYLQQAANQHFMFVRLIYKTY
jgi:hypothetical protein